MITVEELYNMIEAYENEQRTNEHLSTGDLRDRFALTLLNKMHGAFQDGEQVAFNRAYRLTGEKLF